MAGDERGDELFEDLDKFFAPIRDVDWDEPDEPASQTPAEEHVAVRTEPAGTVRVPDEPEAPAPGEEAWYDTGQLEEIDEAVGEPVHETAAPGVDEDAVEVAPTESVADPTLAFNAMDMDDEPEVVVRAPSDEALEAAADHFATSLPRDETYPTEPVGVVISPDAGGAGRRRHPRPAGRGRRRGGAAV